LLNRKETKNQGERPTPILFLAQKSLRNATEKIAVRSLPPKSAALLPTYERLKITFKSNISLMLSDI
jgi:hypothetical protein